MDQPDLPQTLPPRAGWILAAVTLGSGIVFLDGTVVNVALPRIQTDFNAALAGIQWIVDGYTLMLAALLLVGGALGDLYGRKRLFAIGIVVFSLASMLCGLAPSLGVLIVARVAQGIGGALLVPGSLAILTATYPAARRGQAIGTWAAFSSLTAALGPLLGGYLVVAASWRWVFFINVPLSALTLVMLLRVVPESRNAHADPRIDWAGAVCITLGLGGVIFGLIEGPTIGWRTVAVWLALVLGVISLAAFVAIELRSAHPMVPLGLFRSRKFSATNLATLAIYAAFNGALFFTVLDLQQIQGYSAFAAGLALLPISSVLLALSRRSGSVADRVGPRLPMTVGPLLVTLGYLLLLRMSPGVSYPAVVLPAVLVLALGMVITIAPLTTAVMSAVDVDYTGTASGINNAVSRVAAALAIAGLGVLIAVAFSGALDARLPALPISAQARAQLHGDEAKLGATTVPPDVHGAAAAAVQHAIDDAFTAAFRAVMLVCAVLALSGGIISAVGVPGRLLPVHVRDAPGATGQVEPL